MLLWIKKKKKKSKLPSKVLALMSNLKKALAQAQLRWLFMLLTNYEANNATGQEFQILYHSKFVKKRL